MAVPDAVLSYAIPDVGRQLADECPGKVFSLVEGRERTLLGRQRDGRPIRSVPHEAAEVSAELD
jgi:hypothetical protein